MAKGGVPAVESAVRILRFLKDRNHRPWGVSELSRSLQLNKSTCFNILKSLSRYGLVAYDVGTKKYGLGSTLIELGGAASAASSRAEVAKPFLQDLFDELRLTCLLGQRFQDQVIIVDRVEAQDAFRITIPIGQALPLGHGALGRCFLAYLSEADLDRLWVAGTVDQTDRPKGHRYPQIKKALAEVRCRGFAESFGEVAKGVNAVAAPIFDYRGQVILALGVIGFASLLPPRRLARCGRKLREVSGLITRVLGGQPRVPISP
ncbi:MAG: IclR family transcriptional regulator [Candidatus Methylomirabilales bacterium]